jgi:general secretion pathway protein D
MVMKRGKCLIFGLLPLTVSATLLDTLTGVGSNVAGLTGANVNSAPSVSDASGANNGGEMVDQLVLKSADPVEVIGIFEQLTGRTALVEGKLPATKISLEFHEPVSRREAIVAVESVLSLNGIAIVDMGDKFMKVVTSKSALTQSPGIFDDSLLNFEPNQKVFSKFFKLNYMDATEFQKLIKPLLTPNSSNSILFPASNSIYVTDTMANLQGIENLVQRTDTSIRMTEDIKFLPLNNVKASAIAKKFEQLKRGALKKYFSNTTIDFDDSSNQLIIIAHSENFPTIADIAKQLDNKCELLLRSEVIRVKHGDAKKITDIVSEIVKEQRNRIEKENKMAFERQQAQMTAQGSLANALAQAASGSRSNQQISNTYSDFIASQQVPGGELGEEQVAQFSANLTLSSDERSNSIIVYGTASDLSQIRNLVASLDVLLDQVRIEVIVAQITLNEGQQSGLDSLNLGYNQSESYSPFSGEKESTIKKSDGSVETLTHKYKPVAYDINFNGKFGDQGSLGSLTGTLKNFALATIFQKAKTDSNIKILSTPTLVTTHNRKANFKIGEERPFVDSSTKSDDNSSKERVNIMYKHVGLELTVTPLIGNNGIIQMEIDQKISKYDGDVTAGSVQAPVISDKQINSFVSVSNGDVIVLAGFKEKENSKTGGKMFLLGDLPILGDALFTSRKRDEKIKELIIFIKPTIILHPQEEAAYLDKRLEVTNFKEDIVQYKATGDFPKSDPFPKDTLLGLNAEEMDRKRRQIEKEKAKARQNEPVINRQRRHKKTAADDRFANTPRALEVVPPGEPEVFAADAKTVQSGDSVTDNPWQKKQSTTNGRRRHKRTTNHSADTLHALEVVPTGEAEVLTNETPVADEIFEAEGNGESEGFENIVESGPAVKVKSFSKTSKSRSRRRH